MHRFTSDGTSTCVVFVRHAPQWHHVTIDAEGVPTPPILDVVQDDWVLYTWADDAEDKGNVYEIHTPESDVRVVPDRGFQSRYTPRQHPGCFMAKCDREGVVHYAVVLTTDAIQKAPFGTSTCVCVCV